MNDVHSITFTFEKGEQCFCCSKKFPKKTSISQSFTSKKEFEETISALVYNYGIDIQQLKTNKNKSK